jgi:hypothetical protein
LVEELLCRYNFVILAIYDAVMDRGPICVCVVLALLVALLSSSVTAQITE